MLEPLPLSKVDGYSSISRRGKPDELILWLDFNQDLS